MGLEVILKYRLYQISFSSCVHLGFRQNSSYSKPEIFFKLNFIQKREVNFQVYLNVSRAEMMFLYNQGEVPCEKLNVLVRPHGLFFSSAPMGSSFAFMGKSSCDEGNSSFFAFKSMRRWMRFFFLGVRAGHWGAFSATGTYVALP